MALSSHLAVGTLGKQDMFIWIHKTYWLHMIDHLIGQPSVSVGPPGQLQLCELEDVLHCMLPWSQLIRPTMHDSHTYPLSLRLL